MAVKLRELECLPELKISDNVPVITEEEYRSRFESLAELMKKQGFDYLIIYGDREHFSNLYFLTGYEPRFEEALLVFSHSDRLPLLLVGNEGWSYSDIIPYKVKKELFQSFSLVGQPRNSSRNLSEILAETGIRNGSKVGVIGWKYYPEAGSDMIEVPHYIVDTLIKLTGFHNIKNASDLMLHPEYGLRIRLDLKEAVLHEIAGAKTSQGMINLLRNLRPGLSEMEASQLLQVDGEPLVAHPNVNFGAENVKLGLASPTYSRKLAKGDVINIAYGYRRAMSARTGIFVKEPNEIPNSLTGIIENFYMPYFEALTKWYESIEIGVTGGEVFNEVGRTLGDYEKYGVSLNPGHLTHIEEWTTTIFYKNSDYKIASGMAIQCDMIASPNHPYTGVHVEDGIVVADANLREKIKKQFPDSWERIKARKKFLKDILGIDLKEEVLPTSNIQAVLFPFMGNTGLVLSNI